MSQLSEQIEMRLKEINRMLCQLEEELSQAPEGRLRVSASNGFTRYYLVSQGSDSDERYIHRSDPELAKQLAQKSYDRKVQKLLEEEKQLLEKALRYYQKAGPEEFYSGPEELVWSGLNEARKKLVQPVSPDRAFFIEAWQKESYQNKGFSDTDTEYVTDSGIRVRSKTELIIAEMLEKEKIPFHYEKPLLLPGQGIIHPDFTVLNVRTRKTMFWEHQGMMDDDVYRDYALERINQYILAGYYPGEHLILTHETASRPVRTRILKKVIEAYLK